jgi:hypothetical protein
MVILHGIYVKIYHTYHLNFIWSNWVLRTTRGYGFRQQSPVTDFIRPDSPEELLKAGPLLSSEWHATGPATRRYSVRKNENMTWGKLEIWNLMKFVNFNEIMNNYTNYTLRTPNITWHVKASFCFSRVLWDSRFFAGDLETIPAGGSSHES